MISQLQSSLPVIDRGVGLATIQLELNSINKSFPGRENILKDVSFSANEGDSVALIGGNGSGKSTLLRCCLRLIEPDSGSISLLDHDVCSLDTQGLRKFRTKVGLVFQRHNLVPRLSVLSNVIHGAIGRTSHIGTWRQCTAPGYLREEAMQCLEKVGLAHLAASKADSLSGGESQRIAIARALMQKPEFMMADEPVASLDPKVGREVMELFVELTTNENITLLYVSHDLDHALLYSNKLVALQKGQLMLNGETHSFTKSDLYEIYQ
ncbi:MAG: ATP-binding cassette domain-containing protein [Desulfocapsa sp.]|nr:ATP-binding cassette domain-containing protein [Desulfocapsa sp.]